MRLLHNPRTRLILTLELAVVLPAALLVILSALHLKSIQRDRAVEAAIQRDFNQGLGISEKQITMKAYGLFVDARAEFPAPGLACSENLGRILAEYPYLAHVFVYDPSTGLTFVSQPARSGDADFQRERDDLSKMMDGWLKLAYPDMVEEIKRSAHKAPYMIEPNSARRGDKKWLYQPIAMFLEEGKDVQQAIAGMVLDADYLQDKFFPEMLDSVLARNASEGPKERNPAVMMVHMHGESTPLAASSGWDGGEPEVERRMEGAFPGVWLAIKLRGTTLAAIGDHFVKTSFLTLGALSLVLAGGIVLTHRNLAKEMALARLKSDFVSNVSHELRTPLSLIRLYAETLEMGRLSTPEKRQEYYGIIRKESERLTALINNILDFSRIEAGRKEYQFRETDMPELVHNTLESYRYQIEQNGFVFEEKIAQDVPKLRVDREAIARSLLNLVNNALKYSQDLNYIGLHLFSENNCVKLEVVDRGSGIPHAEQQKIFEKFYRVGDPLVHNTKGSGLGLSLVRHIVQAHGGQVAVHSTPGQGSRFTISLPVNGVNLGKAAAV